MLSMERKKESKKDILHLLRSKLAHETIGLQQNWGIYIIESKKYI